MKLEKIRILLADDHPLFRSGIKLLLQRQKDIEIVAEASDGAECVKLAKKFKPDMVLLDLNMEGVGGLEALPLLKKEIPDTCVLMLTVSEAKRSSCPAWGRHGAITYPPRYLSWKCEGRVVRSPMKKPCKSMACVLALSTDRGNLF